MISVWRAEVTMSDFVGKQIGKYKVESRIGRGAMAEVYKAYHPNLDRYVAIKVLHKVLAEKTDILNRFQREARHVASLSHPNIVQVHDFDVLGSIYYMVMEYINGRTLKGIIKGLASKGSVVPLQEAVRIASFVGQALDYAHGKEVMHRDVKPGNVMLDKNNRVVLTDFGLARILSGPTFTTTGAIVGTPAYMSPEQGLGKQGDNRSDIYSLGAMLYHLLTGRFPFTGETPIAIVYKHINAPLPSPRTLNPDIPAPLEAVIMKAMQKDPAERYQAADRMVQDLDEVDRSIMSGDNLARDLSEPVVLESSDGIASLSLHVVETGEIIAPREAPKLVLGRKDDVVFPDVDLTPFEGLKKGVSRKHAEIRIEENRRIFISDLNSTNGTWVNGHRIEPLISIPLHNGDIIAFGKLIVQALIRG
jgi:serine/threonine protein kinase